MKGHEGGLIREQYVSQCPQPICTAGTKPKFVKGTSDQKFSYSSPTKTIDPKELQMNCFDGNRRAF